MHHHHSRNIPSFSLIEMLVVLLLSSIIVGIIYVAFFTVSRYQMDLSKKYIQTDDVSRVYFLLKRDFDRSSTLEALNEFELNCVVPSKLQVHYLFSTHFILREQSNRSDTFHVQINKPAFKWEGKLLEKPGIIDELQIDFTDLAFPASVVILKQYDAASLINNIKTDTLQ